jgi:hypothetical protein
MATFSFDDSEFGGEEAAADHAADQALRSIEESPAPVSDEDAALADVDLRLETADYYRAILNHAFFDVASEASQIVDREIRAFIRERLEILLGLRSPKVPVAVAAPAQFADDEVKALKLLATKVLNKPALAEASKPMVRKMAMPVPEAKPAIRAKPQARKIPAPPPAPSTKPKAKAVVAKPTPSVPAPAAPVVARKFESSPDRTGVTQTYIDANTNRKVTLTEGEIIEEEGRRYKVVANEKGTLYRRDITGQVTNPRRVPPQSIREMEILSQQHAQQSLATLDSTTGAAIVAALSQ